MKVNAFLERGIDFGQYHTYNWAQDDPRSTGDPRLDNNPFFEERVRTDVEKQLAARGFEKTTSGAPDLLLRYHASLTQEIDASGIDRQYGYRKYG